MRIDDIIHLVRAARNSTGVTKITVIGTQSIFGKYSDAPRDLTESEDMDFFTPLEPGKSEEIEGSIGELSTFHGEFGVCGHGVAPETAILPKDWESRAITRQFAEAPGVDVVFLHPVDAVYSKMAAGREKDFEWVSRLFKHRLVNQGEVAILILQCEDEKLKSKLSRSFQIVTKKSPEAVSPASLRGPIFPEEGTGGETPSPNIPKL